MEDSQTVLRNNLLSHICQQCRAIFESPRRFEPDLVLPSQNDGLSWRQTKASFQRAYEDGCRLCSMVWYLCKLYPERANEPWGDWASVRPDDFLDLRYGFSSSFLVEDDPVMVVWRKNDVNSEGSQTWPMRFAMYPISGETKILVV